MRSEPGFSPGATCTRGWPHKNDSTDSHKRDVFGGSAHVRDLGFWGANAYLTAIGAAWIVAEWLAYRQQFIHHGQSANVGEAILSVGGLVSHACQVSIRMGANLTLSKHILSFLFAHHRDIGFGGELMSRQGGSP